MERGLRDLEEEIQMLKSNGALSTEEREEEMKQMEVYRSHSKFMKNKVMMWDTWFLKGEGVEKLMCIPASLVMMDLTLLYQASGKNTWNIILSDKTFSIRITDVVWIFQISLKITCVRLGVYYHDLALHVCQYFWGKQNYIQVSFSPCMKRHILLWNSLKVRTPKGWTHTSFFPPWNGLNKIAPSLQTQFLKGKSFALLLGEELCISGLLLATNTWLYVQ